jgi:hypothetical protein
MVRCFGLVMLLALLALASPAAAQSPFGPPNDLLALGQGGGDTPDQAPIVTAASPSFDAVPRAQCDSASKPEPSVQGRVPARAASKGLWCNMTMLAHQGTSGGFKVFDYVDDQGHECAYYDSTLLFPSNATNIFSNGAGVIVLDMTDPAKPQQTAALTQPSMLSPHESLNLNAERGLLAAVNGNPATEPGWVAFYDLHKDCRHPELDFSGPLARLGHESGFSSDGKTFYATATAYQSITAIDVTDPKAPSVIWNGNVQSHGMSLSPDGNRAYLANPDVKLGDLIILDTSEIQARKPNPHTRELSRTTWDRVSIPQNAMPFTKDGHPYLLEFDEYNASTLDPSGDPNMVGAARIMDISDEHKPTIVSNIRLAIDNPQAHAQYGGDPGADGSTNGGAQGYAAHYCNLDSRVDPTLVACSFIASGLRLFDISDVAHPREVGYFVAPTGDSSDGSDFAMSQPAFIAKRREILWTDGNSGFYVLRVDPKVSWPAPTSTSTLTCSGRRLFSAHVKVPRGTRVRSASVTLAGHKVKRTVHGRVVTTRVDLRHLRRSAVVLRFTVRLTNGRTITSRRTYHPCTKRIG